MLITFWTRSTLQRLRCLGTQLSPGRREAAARRDRWGNSSSTGNVAGAASEVTQTHERQHSQNPVPHGVTNRGSLPGQNVTARVCSLTLPHALSVRWLPGCRGAPLQSPAPQAAPCAAPHPWTQQAAPVSLTVRALPSQACYKISPYFKKEMFFPLSIKNYLNINHVEET